MHVSRPPRAARSPDPRRRAGSPARRCTTRARIGAIDAARLGGGAHLDAASARGAAVEDLGHPCLQARHERRFSRAHRLPHTIPDGAPAARGTLGGPAADRTIRVKLRRAGPPQGRGCTRPPRPRCGIVAGVTSGRRAHQVTRAPRGPHRPSLTLALERINEGTYGTCDVCGGEIRAGAPASAAGGGHLPLLPARSGARRVAHESCDQRSR